MGVATMRTDWGLGSLSVYPNLARMITRNYPLKKKNKHVCECWCGYVFKSGEFGQHVLIDWLICPRFSCTGRPSPAYFTQSKCLVCGTACGNQVPQTPTWQLIITVKEIMSHWTPIPCYSTQMPSFTAQSVGNQCRISLKTPTLAVSCCNRNPPEAGKCDVEKLTNQRS